MPDLIGKLHQIQFRLTLRPIPPDLTRGAHSAPPDSLAGKGRG